MGDVTFLVVNVTYMLHISGVDYVFDVGLFLLPANEVWDKVMFLHLSVILFTGGPPTPPRMQPPVMQTPWNAHPPGCRHSPGCRCPPPTQDTWDIVNKRAVHFLLECILVDHMAKNCSTTNVISSTEKHNTDHQKHNIDHQNVISVTKNVTFDQKCSIHHGF